MLKLTEKKRFPDGSASYIWEVDEVFLEEYKAKTGQTKLDGKEISEYIVKMLEEGFKELSLKTKKAVVNKQLKKVKTKEKTSGVHQKKKRKI